MIKNVTDSSWDADEKTVMLICKRGKQLQELACSMGIRAIVSIPPCTIFRPFLRTNGYPAHLHATAVWVGYAPALHIIQLRNDDTCVWVMRRRRSSSSIIFRTTPEMKLEWISLDDDDRVERIIRLSDLPKKEKRPTKESKGKQTATASGGHIGGETFPVFSTSDPWNMDSDSEDEDDDLLEQKIETVGDIHFYDVWGVRIFKRKLSLGDSRP